MITHDMIERNQALLIVLVILVVAVGGLLFFGGMLIMFYNMLKTIAGATAADAPIPAPRNSPEVLPANS